jgi:hypothetical protein
MGDFAGKLDLTHMPNVDVMAAPDQFKAAILKVADDNKDVIMAARGTAMPHAEMIGLAQDLAVNTDTLQQTFDREFGPVADTAAGNQRRVVITAARIVEQNAAGTMLALSDAVADGTASSAHIVDFMKNMQAIADWRTRLASGSAEWGRNLNALGAHVGPGLPPEVMDHIAGIIKQNNPDLQAVAQAVKLAGTPSGIATIIHGSLAYRALIKAPWTLLQRTFINGILSGPGTWAKIIVGNNLNLALNDFDLVAAGVGRGMTGLAARVGGWPTAAEGAQLSDAMAHVHGVISGGADALRIAGRVMKTGQSLDGIMRSQEDFGKNTLVSGQNPILPELRDSYFGGIARVVDTLVDLPGSRVIAPIDSFTQTLGYRGYQTMMALKEVRARITAGTIKPGDAEQAMVELMTNPSPELQQASEAWAHRMTFQSPFPEGGAMEAFSNVLNKAPALRFIFPFMRTATNIFKQSLIERTPLAVFSSRLRNQIAAGGFEGDLAKARIATGTAAISMWAWMAIHDRITGDAPKDSKERALWALDGRTANSVRVTDSTTGKDTWHDYSWLEPIATVASATADAVKLMSILHRNDDNSMMEQKDQLDDAIAHIAASVIQNTGNKTFMQGAAQFSEMYNDPQRFFKMWGQQIGASLVPYSGATKFIRNTQDPFMRQAYTLMDKIKNDLPTGFGVKGSKTLPASLDVFGQPRMHRGGNAILGPLNPLPGSESTKDPVTDEIQSIMEQTRTTPITMPSHRIAMLGSGKGLQDGTGMQLTPAEYNEYTSMSRSDPVKEFGGLSFKDRLEQKINTPVYQQASPAARSAFLEQIKNQADRNGRERLFSENKEFAQRLMDWTAEANRKKFNQ